MKTQTYDRVSNTCVAVVVVSALLAPALAEYSWVAAGIAIIAALIAAGIFVYHAAPSETEEDHEEN